MRDERAAAGLQQHRVPVTERGEQKCPEAVELGLEGDVAEWESATGLREHRLHRRLQNPLQAPSGASGAGCQESRGGRPYGAPTKPRSIPRKGREPVALPVGAPVAIGLAVTRVEPALRNELTRMPRHTFYDTPPIHTPQGRNRRHYPPHSTPTGRCGSPRRQSHSFTVRDAAASMPDARNFRARSPISGRVPEYWLAKTCSNTARTPSRPMPEFRPQYSHDGGVPRWLSHPQPCPLVLGEQSATQFFRQVTATHSQAEPAGRTRRLNLPPQFLARRAR